MAKNHPPTGYEPNVLDDFQYSETTEMIFQEESGDIDTEPSYLCDAELDDETIGKALSSPLFIQEREEPADRRQASLSHEESLLPAQSFFTHTRTGETRTRTKFRFVSKTEIKSRLWKTSESGFSLKDKSSKFLLKSDLRSRNTNFKPSLIQEVFRNYLELLILSEWKLTIL